MFGWNFRTLPKVNYAESDSSEEDLESGLNFDSPLQTPQTPLPTREGSPVDHVEGGPTLADNVDDTLEEVNYKLGDIAVVREEIEEITDKVIRGPAATSASCNGLPRESWDSANFAQAPT